MCCQSLFKVHPDFDKILRAILINDHQGIIVFFQGKHKNWADLLEKRLRSTIKDASARIFFLPRQPYHDYLDLISLSDVVLDTVHFNGGATTFDALAVGTPIVTLPGKFLRGRQTFSLYKRMEVMDCVANTPEEYVNIAVRLGSDPTYRNIIKKKILSNNQKIFEDTGMVRELEACLIKMTKNTRSSFP